MSGDKYPAELVEKVAKAIDGHGVIDSRNLGYYRTEIECACGVKLQYGGHPGDPSRDGVWSEHIAVAALDALDLTFEYGTAIKETDGTVWDHYPHGGTPADIRALIAEDDRSLVMVWRVAETSWEVESS